MESTTLQQDPVTPPHPRVLGRHCRARHGRQQPDDLPDHGAVRRSGSDPRARQRRPPLLIVGVLLGWAAAPAWTELVLMWPNRVGGISAACAEAFRPYNPVLAALLLVGLGADLRLDRSALCLSLPALVLPRASGRSCGHHHRLLFQLRELWPIDCSMPWQSHSRCAASKSPLGSASAARSIPKTRPTSMR